jgi:hypothetical protein
MAVNSEQLSQKITCEKCSQNEANVYSFHYGRKASQTTRQSGRATITTAKYDIAGEKHAAACNKCIRGRRLTRLVVFGVITAIAAVLALWAASWDQFADPTRISEVVRHQMAIFAIAGILGLIGLWGLLPNLFTGRKTHAENLIIALKKNELQRQGFDTFWNNRNFSKLKRG